MVPFRGHQLCLGRYGGGNRQDGPPLSFWFVNSVESGGFFLFCFCILQSGKGVGVSGIAGTCACYSAPAPLMLGGSGGGEGALGAQEGL